MLIAFSEGGRWLHPQWQAWGRRADGSGGVLPLLLAGHERDSATGLHADWRPSELRFRWWRRFWLQRVLGGMVVKWGGGRLADFS